MTTVNFNLQPILENEMIKIIPLKPDDFDTLYAIASDPLLWEQHPNKDRYKRHVFEIFFKGAIESKGAFLVYDKVNNLPIGSSRYYTVEGKENTIAIGYTFIARDHWGGKYNPALKKLMINHALRFVDSVVFHIGAVNVRSQKAIERLGAIKIDEEDMAYFGEASKLNFIYEIRKENWRKRL